jgi:2-polyprenyl-3-methyl-5-hydroxy-6-metoxy-1,4-benzoquinol methylase
VPKGPELIQPRTDMNGSRETSAESLRSGRTTRIASGGGSFAPAAADLDGALREYRSNGDHWTRYRFARTFTQGSAVLDWGCGHGLGAAILSGCYSRYVGIDNDGFALAWAEDKLAPAIPCVEFVAEEAARRRLGAEKFDLVLCFEVLEHVDQPVALLVTLLGFLKPGGTLLLSTPNGYLTQHRRELFQSQFHIDEYSESEIAKMLMATGLEFQLLRQFRFDHLDSILLILRRRFRRAQSPSANSERGRMPRLRTLMVKGTRRVYRMWLTHLNGPRAWKISPRSTAGSPSVFFTTIVAKVRTPPSTSVRQYMPEPK